MAAKNSETLVILDYGSQYTQLIGRRVRELNVFSVILPFNASLEEILSHKPKGIVLSGGPNSVYAEMAPKLDIRLLDTGLPILGICYGLHLLTMDCGGKVEASPKREYGLARLHLEAKSRLLPAEVDNSQIWMSHGDYVQTPPTGFVVTARSGDIISAFEDHKRNLYGIQFHPEVTHSEKGSLILKKFLVDICGFQQDWTTESFIEQEVARIRKLVGKQKVICALSGGVDSSVAATLVDRAIGEQQLCIFIDNGLLRQNEYDEVLAAYKQTGLNVKPVRASKHFLTKLANVTDPEQKRKIIGREFIRLFEKEAKADTDVAFLVQGTLYPDVIESVSVHGPSAVIKSHHNVGGLPEKMHLKLLEPLRELFKDEVRLIGSQLGLPPTITARQPFPGPGLAVRLLGPITADRLAVLQAADAIVREEIMAADAQHDLWQYFAVLLPVKTVGVMGDARTYEEVIAVRAVASTDGMTADWAKLSHELLSNISSRIISEVRGVNRVVYDITSKPPGTIEWE